MGADGKQAARPRKARLRKTLSCRPCRKRKVKCDYKFPCTQCKLRKKTELCAYDGHNRWGYSSENSKEVAGVLSMDKNFDSWLTKCVESKLLPEFDQHEQLLTIYRDICHPQFPLLILSEIQQSYETMKSTGKLDHIRDGVNLFLVYSFACGNASDSSQRSDVCQKYAQAAHELISLFNLLAIQTIEDLQTLILYVIYVYYNDSVLPYNNVSQLIGIIVGTFRSRPVFRECLKTLYFFNLMENVISQSQGICSITKCNSMFDLDDLYMKCRHTLMKYRDRMFTENMTMSVASFTAFENEVKSAGGTFGVLCLNLATDTYLNRYHLAVILSQCNQICLSLYRPYLLKRSVESSKTSKLEIFRDKVLGFALILIEIAVAYNETMNMNNQFSLQCWNDIYMGAFQGSVILMLDKIYRSKNRYSLCDQADDYFRYAFWIPAIKAPLSRAQWKTGDPGWRQAAVEEFYKLLVNENQVQVNPKSRNAILVLKGLLSDSPEINVPKLFGPFKSSSSNTPDETRIKESVPAIFNSDFFISSVSKISSESAGFEELCYQVLTERI